MLTFFQVVSNNKEVSLTVQLKINLYRIHNLQFLSTPLLWPIQTRQNKCIRKNILLFPTNFPVQIYRRWRIIGNAKPLGLFVLKGLVCWQSYHLLLLLLLLLLILL